MNLNGRFDIYLRRRQNTFEGNNVITQCDPLTEAATYVPGTVDNSSPFMDIDSEQGWYLFNNYIEPDTINKLGLTWDKINNGNSTNSNSNPDGSNYDKGITLDLTFFDKAYHFIYDWLLTSECQILNAVEVKIIDLIAGGTYRIFEIKGDNIDYAPFDEPCIFHIKLREQDNTWHRVHKTLIFDNWQHWFDDSTTKEHPCFLTCVEPRPRIINSVRMSLLIFWHAFTNVLSILTFGLLNFILDLFSDSDMTEDARKILNANRFVDSPLIRTYIENFALKYGYATDTIFDEGEEWENLCLYYPQAGFMHESDSDATLSPALYYHFDNRWLITIAELLDKLKAVFCAEWYITPNNTLLFKHTQDLINLDAIYDFTDEFATPIYDLRYTFNGDKKPAYGRYEYQSDGSDLASQEASTLYNDIVDFDGKVDNPLLEGERNKSFEFAPTGFVRDGRSIDYLEKLIEDGSRGAKLLIGIIGIVMAGLIDGTITFPAAAALVFIVGLLIVKINSKGNQLKDTFVGSPVYTGAVRVTSEQVLTPRLLLWDGISKQRAKVEQTAVLPTPNTYYNTDSIPYDDKNKIDIDNPDLVIYNYPLYFDGDFKGNLFDRYHNNLDNPLLSKESHQDAKWNVDLCEEMLNILGVFENQYAVIGKIVRLEARNNYDVYVRIGNINVDYDNNLINLKGRVLRRTTAPIIDIGCNTFEINEQCFVINGSFITIN